MRILFISNLYPPAVLGGYEILCGQVADAFQARGHEVAVLTTNHETTSAPNDDGPIKVHRTLRLVVPFDQPYRQNYRHSNAAEQENAARTTELIQSFKPDLVFMWSPLRLSLGPALAAEQSGVPVAYTLNDINLLSYVPPAPRMAARPFVRYARHRLNQLVWHTTDVTDLRWEHVTCISEDLKERIIEMGVPIDRACVIYQGIPAEHFPAKSKPGSLHTPLRVLYVGALLPYKGVHTVIDAVQDFARRHTAHAPVLSLVGAEGPDDYMNRLRSLAASGPADVRFLGRRSYPELPEVYREHDVFVFASSALEGFGLTHLEAMASGTTVIATDKGGHAESMKHGDNALLFRAGDATSLRELLEELVARPELSERLALRARHVVETDFTLDGYVYRIEKWLKQIVESAARAA